MAEIATAWVSILPSSRNFGARLQSSVGKDVKKAGKTSGLSFGKVFAVAAGLGIGAKVGSFLGDSIGEAREAQKVGAATEQIIKSTGGAAKITAAQVGALSSALSRKVGVDDEAIQSGANLLLTFKNVKREGEGLNDIFGRATAAAVDLSAAGFGDLNGASKQLGKALNDPLKGITALSRSGVTFTEGQKEQIKGYVESNNLLAAQKVILKEVESQVGGVAEATATSGEKARVAFGNLKESIGTALLPAVDALSNAFVALAPSLEKGVTKIGPIFSTIRKAVTPVFTVVANFVRKNPTFVKAFAIALGGLAAAIGVVTLATAAFSIALNTTGIPLVIIGIAALVAGLVVAYKRSEDFRNIVNAVGAGLKDFGVFVKNDVLPVVQNVARYVGQKMRPVFKQLGETFRKDILPTARVMVARFREAQPTIQKVAAVVLRVTANLIKLNVAVLSKVLPPLIRFGGFLSRTLIPAGLQTAGMFVTAIRRVVEFAQAIGRGIQAVTRFATGVQQKIATAARVIGGIPGKAKDAIGDLGSTLYNAGRELIAGLIRGIEKKFSDVKDTISGVADTIKGYFPGSPVKTGPLRSFNKGAVGVKLMQMILQGIKQGEGPLLKRIARAAKQIAKAFDQKKITANTARMWNQWLNQLGNQFERLNNRVATANGKLKNLLKARSELMRSTAEGIRGEFSLGDLASSTNEFGFSDLTFGKISGTVRALVARVKTFARKLLLLRKAGFGSLVGEVAGLGSVDGLRVANVLLSGSRAERQGLQADLRDLRAASLQVGTQVAGQRYNGAIADARDRARERRELRQDFLEALRDTRLNITVGADKRTKTKWYLEGRDGARALA